MLCQVENLLSVVAATSITGATSSDVAVIAENFTGLEHRIEWVRTIHGVDFVNNSKGTNVGSVHKSLTSFSRPVILIAGGKDKGGDFFALKEIFKEKIGLPKTYLRLFQMHKLFLRFLLMMNILEALLS